MPKTEKVSARARALRSEEVRQSDRSHDHQPVEQQVLEETPDAVGVDPPGAGAVAELAHGPDDQDDRQHGSEDQGDQPDEHGQPFVEPHAG